MSTSDKAGRLTAELLQGVEAYDSRAVLRTLKRIIPSHTRRVMVALAVIALVNIKQQHGDSWPEHVTPSLESYDKDAS